MKQIFTFFFVTLLLFVYLPKDLLSQQAEESGNNLPELLKAEANQAKCVSLSPGLIANSFDWGKRRITRPNFPMGPYPASDDVITLQNTGTATVYIKDVILKTNNRGYAFNISSLRNSIMGLSIPAHNKRIIPATFQPDTTGDFELVFDYDNDGSQTSTTLRGQGLLPRLATYDYNFGSTLINDESAIQTRRIVIKNVKYEWADSVTITDIVCGSSISADGKSPGESGFFFDKSSLGLPRVLHIGDSLVFNASFIAKKLGKSLDSIITKSDAERDVISYWTGSSSTDGVNSGEYNVKSVSLNEIAPNPTANSEIEISFYLPHTGMTEIIIYNEMGQEIAKPISREMTNGDNSMMLNVANLQPGLYFVRLISGNSISVKKFVVSR